MESSELTPVEPQKKLATAKKLTFCLLAMLAALPLEAQDRSNSAAIERGGASFASTCGFCHGAQAKGTEQAPNLVRSRLVHQDQNGELLGPMIQAGRPILGMPSFASLPGSELADIIAFLHAQATAARGHGVPESAMLVGNTEAGRAFFNGGGKCSNCHSVGGDLAGIGTRLTPMVITTSFLTPPDKPLTVRVTLPTGETIAGRLEYLDEFNVSLYDSANEYHTWSRDKLGAVTIIDPLAAHKEMMPKYTDEQIHNLLAYLFTLK